MGRGSCLARLGLVGRFCCSGLGNPSVSSTNGQRDVARPVIEGVQHRIFRWLSGIMQVYPWLDILDKRQKQTRGIWVRKVGIFAVAWIVSKVHAAQC